MCLGPRRKAEPTKTANAVQNCETTSVASWTEFRPAAARSNRDQRCRPSLSEIHDDALLCAHHYQPASHLNMSTKLPLTSSSAIATAPPPNELPARSQPRYDTAYRHGCARLSRESRLYISASIARLRRCPSRPCACARARRAPPRPTRPRGTAARDRPPRNIAERAGRTQPRRACVDAAREACTGPVLSAPAPRRRAPRRS